MVPALPAAIALQIQGATTVAAASVAKGIMIEQLA